MSDTERPLTTALAQGWEVTNYSASVDPTAGMLVHCFLLRRQGRSKLLVLRKKMIGEGTVADELEV
jgi:hypothetical protein